MSVFGRLFLKDIILYNFSSGGQKKDRKRQKNRERGHRWRKLHQIKYNYSQKKQWPSGGKKREIFFWDNDARRSSYLMIGNPSVNIIPPSEETLYHTPPSDDNETHQTIFNWIQTKVRNLFRK